MEKPFPKLCASCKFSVPEDRSHWILSCVNPQVNAKDAFALAAVSGSSHGTSCTDERSKGWFSVCGMRGAKFEQKP